MIYVGLLLAFGLALTAFGIKGNSGLNTAALVGAVLWACHWFAGKNGRYFSRIEKPRVVLGMLAIDLVLQAAVTFFVAGVVEPDLTMGPLLGIFAIVGIVHAIGIYVFVGMAGKQYARQVAK